MPQHGTVWYPGIRSVAETTRLTARAAADVHQKGTGSSHGSFRRIRCVAGRLTSIGRGAAEKRSIGGANAE
jgi:hypothetical protein